MVSLKSQRGGRCGKRTVDAAAPSAAVFTDDDIVFHTNEAFVALVRPAIMSILTALTSNYDRMAQWLAACTDDQLKHLQKEPLFRQLISNDRAQRLRLYGNGPNYAFYMAKHLAMAVKSIDFWYWRQLPSDTRAKLNNPDHLLELWVSRRPPIIKPVADFTASEFARVLDRNEGILSLQQQSCRAIATGRVWDYDRLDEVTKIEEKDGSVMLYNKRGQRIIASKAKLRKHVV